MNCRLSNVRILEKIYRHCTVSLFCSFLLLYYRFFVGFVTHLLDFFGLLHWGWLSYDGPVYYNDVIMSAIASKLTGVSIVCSAVCSGVDQRKPYALLAFMRRIHQWPVDSLHKGQVTQKMFPFDDVILEVTLPKKWVKLTCVKSRVSVTASHCIWNKQQGRFYQEMATDIRVSESNQHCFKTLPKPLMGWDP